MNTVQVTTFFKLAIASFVAGLISWIFFSGAPLMGAHCLVFGVCFAIAWKRAGWVRSILFVLCVFLVAFILDFSNPVLLLQPAGGADYIARLIKAAFDGLMGLVILFAAVHLLKFPIKPTAYFRVPLFGVAASIILRSDSASALWCVILGLALAREQAKPDTIA